jgi:predicted metal-dependent phosphoesterase TrpH
MNPWTRWTAIFGILTLVAVSPALADERKEIAFPDVPGYVTLMCDFHMHTVFSDGSVWPTVRVNEAWREGLDAIAITDHIEYQPHKEDLPTKHNRPYELALDLARTKNVLLVRGAEITRDTPPGHFNAILLDDVEPLDTPEFFDVFAEAARQKAFVFWNHPNWQGPEKGKWGDKHSRLLEQGHLHGIEVCNGDYYDEIAHREALKRNLVLVGNSDVHDPVPDDDWTPTMHRTLTLVLAREKSVDALREALAAGRTAVWWKNKLIGREALLRSMFEACVAIRPPHRRTADAVWVEIDNHSELDIELRAAGDAQPALVKLPARSTALVRFQAPPESLRKGLPYRAVNFVPDVGTSLDVMLAVAPAEADAHVAK